MDVRTYIIDDEEYILINQVNYNDLKYVYLAKENGENPMVQKIYNNKPGIICGLDSKEEYEFAMSLFAEKLKNRNKAEENNS